MSDFLPSLGFLIFCPHTLKINFGIKLKWAEMKRKMATFFIMEYTML